MNNYIKVVSNVDHVGPLGYVEAQVGMNLIDTEQEFVRNIVSVSNDVVVSSGIEGQNRYDYAWTLRCTQAEAEASFGWPTGVLCHPFL